MLFSINKYSKKMGPIRLYITRNGNYSNDYNKELD